MAQPHLPRQTKDRLLAHMQVEVSVLQRIQNIASAMTAGGISAPELATRQSELATIASDTARLHHARLQLRLELAQGLGCAPEDVRLSRIQLESPAATRMFQEQRQATAELAVRAAAGLRTAETTLRGWSGIISFVLGEVMITPRGADRYSAKGQLVTGSPQIGIELRS